MALPTQPQPHPGETQASWPGRLFAAKPFRFLFVGAIGYLVNQLFLFLLYDTPLGLGLPPPGATFQTPLFYIRDVHLLIASVLAVEISIVSNFLWHRWWTFSERARQPMPLQFLRFNLGSLGGPAISLLMVNTLTPILDVHYLVANSLGILLGTTWNWVWASKVVWRRRPAA